MTQCVENKRNIFQTNDDLNIIRKRIKSIPVNLLIQTLLILCKSYSKENILMQKFKFFNNNNKSKFK